MLEARLTEIVASVSEYMKKLAQLFALTSMTHARTKFSWALHTCLSSVHSYVGRSTRVGAGCGEYTFTVSRRYSNTFVYLAKEGRSEDFERFIAYGEGQRKLWMLHLEENLPRGHDP